MFKVFLRASVMLTLLVSPLLSCGTVTQDLGLPPYYGPSDLDGTAYGWWGLRAFGNAQVGSAIAVVHCALSAKDITVNSTASGDFDVTALTAACPTTVSSTAETYTVSTLFDQSGYGVDLVQTSPALCPQLALNCIGSLPCMVFDGSTTVLTGALSATLPQPLTITAVASDTSSSPVAGGTIIGNDPSAFATLSFSYLSNNLVSSMSSDSTSQNNPLVSSGFASSSYHFIAGIFSSTVSSLYVDYSLISTGNAGANGLGPSVSVGASATAPIGNYLKGQVFELGIFPAAFSPTTVSTFTTSARNYWGF